MVGRWQFIFLTAWRFLREAKAQTAITLFGITLGVMVIVFLARLIDRLEDNMVERVLSSQADIVITATEQTNQALDATNQDAEIIVQPRTQSEPTIANWQAVMNEIARQPAVTAVAPLAMGTVFAIRGQTTKAVVLLGTNPQQYNQLLLMDSYMQQGQFDYAADQAIIGIELAATLGASVGDKIFLRNADGFNNTLLIRGIFDIGNRDLNARWVFVRLKEAQNLLNLGGDITRLDVKIDSIFTANQVADRLHRLTGLNAASWMRTNQSLMEALTSQSSSNMLIRSFLLMMIIATIVSVLTVTVVQKNKEIGILRAMGAKQAQIGWIFIFQGGLLGLFGAIFGILIAWLVMLIFAWLPVELGTVLPNIRLNLATVLQTILGVSGVGMLAAYLPARKASKLNIITAIQR